jgi:tRNA(fMet)-specific endonuclease VapC
VRAQELLKASQSLLASIAIFPVDDTAASKFDNLRLNKKVKKIGRTDLLISSIALAHNATVVTRNLQHFKQVPGLKVENWMAS